MFEGKETENQSVWIDDDKVFMHTSEQSLANILKSLPPIKDVQSPEMVDEVIYPKSFLPMLMILDINFAWDVDYTGVDLYQRFRSANPFTPVVFYSGVSYLSETREQRERLRSKFHENTEILSKGKGSTIHQLAQIIENAKTVTPFCATADYLKMPEISKSLAQRAAYNFSYDHVGAFFNENPDLDYVTYTLDKSKGVNILNSGRGKDSIAFNSTYSPIFYNLNLEKYSSSLAGIYDIKYRLDREIVKHLKGVSERKTKMFFFKSSNEIDSLEPSKQIYFAKDLIDFLEGYSDRKRVVVGQDNAFISSSKDGLETVSGQINSQLDLVTDNDNLLREIKYSRNDTDWVLNVPDSFKQSTAEVSILPVFCQVIYSENVLRQLYQKDFSLFNSLLSSLDFHVQIFTLKELFKERVLSGIAYGAVKSEIKENIDIEEISTIDVVYEAEVIEIDLATDKAVVSVQDFGKIEAPQTKFYDLSELQSHFINEAHSQFEIVVYRNKRELPTIYKQLTL